jgi:surface antigen
MKKLFTSLVILISTISLIGCQNMSNQDVGVITGGIAGGLLGSTVGKGSGQILAIAAGTVAGSIIGGSIGKSMDDVDRMKMNKALEGNPVGKPAYWHNAHTGTRYEVVPTRNVSIEGNEYCREYRTVAIIAGKKQQIYGTACRQPDGSWEAVK